MNKRKKKEKLEEKERYSVLPRLGRVKGLDAKTELKIKMVGAMLTSKILNLQVIKKI